MRCKSDSQSSLALRSLAGILAFGFMQLNGAHGIGGWSWIFILEGVVCRNHLCGRITLTVSDHYYTWPPLLCKGPATLKHQTDTQQAPATKTSHSLLQQ